MRAPLILLLRPHPAEPGPLARVGPTAVIPVLRVVQLPGALEKVAEALGRCDWLVLTSPRAPAMLAPLRSEIAEAVATGRLHVAAVGPKTRDEVLRRLGVEPSLMPGSYTGARLARELARLGPRCVLAPRSELANPELRRVLEEAGVEVVEVPLYTVEPIEPLASAAASIADRFDYVVFTSPSVADAFAAHYGGPARFRPVAIGPTTAARLIDLGFPEPLTAAKHTLEGVAKAIEEDWRRSGSRAGI